MKKITLSKVKLPTRISFINMNIKTFPIVNAISVTTYKIQGDTLPAMIIANWRSNTKADKPEQGYVIVSRVKERKSILVLEPLTLQICSYFKPTIECLHEDERLNKLSIQTITKFYNK